ncbi:GntR family transcriptional regulator [Paenibacillus ihumii]|uniref:GntR family transcriptional regulator n=1 Tax=Paenibacillus ihumii TaxID=687436 RepID=UPI0006D802A8|nr:GntR family transcriptional regulator [Paenibacillus ihumii]
MASEENGSKTENNKVPLYVSIYDEIFNKIKIGEFKAGEKLPSENLLAEMFNISRGTLRQALLLLQEDGIIFNWQGKGNFVTANFRRLDAGLEKVSIIPLGFSKSDCHVVLEEINYQPATKKIQENLQLEQSKLVVVFKLNFISDGQISCNTVLFIPYEKLNDYNVSLEDKEQLKNFIFQYIDVNVIHAHMELRIVEARESIAEQIGVEVGKALICFIETMYSEFGIPVIYSKSYCLPEMFNFHINRRKL